jgi:AmmeMemoRadiSam system protein B
MDKEQYTYYQKNADIPPIKERVLGGILSHHFFTEKYLSDFFNKFREQKPSTIVILSPNHFSAGTAPIATSRLPYQTPWGTVDPDLDTIDQLEKDGVIQTDEYIFEREHGISTPVGFLPKAFPETKIIPIATRRFVNKEQMVKLATDLDKILPSDALVLASINFSHHLNIHSTTFHDAVSEVALKSFDFDSIYNLEIDSPPSLYAFLKYMELRKGRLIDLVHTNQAEISNNIESEDITSYFFALYSADKNFINVNKSAISITQWPVIRSTQQLIFDRTFTGPEKNNLRGQQISVIPYTSISANEASNLAKKLSPFNPYLLLAADKISCQEQKDWTITQSSSDICIYRKEFTSQAINMIIGGFDAISTVHIPDDSKIEQVTYYNLGDLDENQVDKLFMLGADQVTTIDRSGILKWYNSRSDSPISIKPIDGHTQTTAALGSLLDEKKLLFALPFGTSTEGKIVRADYFAGLKICSKLSEATDINLPCKLK